MAKQIGFVTIAKLIGFVTIVKQIESLQFGIEFKNTDRQEQWPTQMLLSLCYCCSKCEISWFADICGLMFTNEYGGTNGIFTLQ